MTSRLSSTASSSTPTNGHPAICRTRPVYLRGRVSACDPSWWMRRGTQRPYHERPPCARTRCHLSHAACVPTRPCLRLRSFAVDATRDSTALPRTATLRTHTLPLVARGQRCCAADEGLEPSSTASSPTPTNRYLAHAYARGCVSLHQRCFSFSDTAAARPLCGHALFQERSSEVLAS